jgi:hypothetical protein
MADAAEQAIVAGKATLARALSLPDRTHRMLGVVGAVQRALADLGLRPVVVGGLAVEYYTAGEYVTGDIDVLVPTTERVTARLEALGFQREGPYGRHWTLPGAEIIWEMPGAEMGAEDQDPREVEFAPGEAVLMLRVEDVLVHRVEEWVATGHLDALEQALALLGAPAVDEDRLSRRAQASSGGAQQGLRATRDLARRVQQGDNVDASEAHRYAQEIRRELRGGA